MVLIYFRTPQNQAFGTIKTLQMVCHISFKESPLERGHAKTSFIIIKLI